MHPCTISNGNLSMVLAKPTPYAKEDEWGRGGQREGFYDRRREKGEDPTNCNTFFKKKKHKKGGKSLV